MHLPRGPLLHRAFGDPFGGGCIGFFPPFGVGCTTTSTLTTAVEKTTEKTTKTEKGPPTTKTTVIVSPTVITSVVVVTSGNTITAGTTFTSGTTVTSVITPTSPATPGPTDKSLPTSSDTSAPGDTSPSSSSPSGTSSDVPQPTAIPHQTITDTETLVISTSPPSSSVLTPPTSPSSASPNPTVIPTQSTPQSSQGMSTGEIAAICIACVGILVILVLIWIAWRKRAARKILTAASGSAGPEDGANTLQSNAAEASVRTAAAPHAPESHRLSSDGAGHMEEKRDTISRYSDSGETASSPGSSTALSSFPLLSPGLVTPTNGEPALARMRSFRLAWDDPPPTPDLRPVSLQSGQHAAYRRFQGGNGYLVATTENYDRSSVFVTYLARGGRSEVTLSQPPEYSRY